LCDDRRADGQIERGLAHLWQIRENLQLYHVSGEFLRVLFAANPLEA